jgi:hydroxymethylpyrimidine kinase/phosphomethylpyrimidine kinase
LSIAGSESGGGAGIQADLKAMAHAGVHGTTAITSLTAQNSTGVNDIHPIPPEFLREQIDAVVSDAEITATKTGMLFGADIMDVVIDERARLGKLIVDPVMVAESGDSLFDEGAESTLVEGLLPNANLVTPNRHETKIIADQLGIDPDDDEVGHEIARRLDGPAVLVKGGHSDEPEAVDYLYDSDGLVREYRAPRLDTENTHGSGCVYSSLITAYVARGRSIEAAVDEAKGSLTDALRRSYSVGKGPGTLNLLKNQGDEP